MKTTEKISENKKLLSIWSVDNVESPDKITVGSNKNILWECNLGHKWNNTPKHMSKRKQPCPYCSVRKVLKGFNDFETTHPNIAKMWSEKNNIKANEVTYGSGEKVFWKCNLGHEWEATVI